MVHLKAERAQEMRQAGFKFREISEELKAPIQTVWGWVNPDRRNGRAIDPARTRVLDLEYNKRNRRSCSRCGGDRPRQFTGPICKRCIQDDVDSRGKQIERWWAEGLTLGEIAERLGWTEKHVGSELHRLREKGYELPYRYRKGGRRVST